MYVLRLYVWTYMFPQPGLPEGVLTFSSKECVTMLRPDGSPVTGEPVPPVPKRIQMLQNAYKVYGNT
jgi:hypothetical protein